MPLLARFVCSTIWLLGVGIVQLNAQANSNEPPDHSLTLRLSPFSLLEGDGNIMLGAGYQFHRRWAVSFDPAYIFWRPYQGLVEENPGKSSGIKLRGDIRYLFDRSKPGRFSSFIGPEFHYKYVESKKSEDFGINCIGGQCDYYQREEYKEIKTEIGGSVKVGTLVRLSTRWNLELYGGVGVKFFAFSEADIPLGGTFLNRPNQNPFFNTDRKPVQVMVPIGAKFTFLIR
jgi:hypothetical protein